MQKHGIRAIYSMLGLAPLWFISLAAANAQVTITSVKVTESSATLTAVYCDTSLGCGASGGIQVWNLGGGITVNPGQTLVLTQTGLVPVGGNFDTSDQVTPTTVGSCSTSNPCTVAIEINGVLVYSNGGGNPINFYNTDDGGQATNEAHDWVLAATKPNYTLQLGYADDVHSGPCPATGCFPNPFSGATYFLGVGEPAVGFFGVGATGPCPSNCYDSGALLITGVLAPVTATGRMTGGGSVFEADGTRVTHGFEIHCDITDTPNNLEVNWPAANNFHMDTLTSATCTDDPNINQHPPKSAPFDTFVGTGTGKLNGVAGATISFTFVDAGEPGTSDTAAYLIKDNMGNTVLNVPATPLTKGNQQTHK